MVVIRLTRGGTNKRPFYHVIVSDRRCARDGNFIENLGYFNPIAHGGEKRLEVDKERLTYWLTKGAQPSARVTSLMLELEKPEILEKRKKKSVARKAAAKTKAKEQAGEKTAAAESVAA